MSRGAVLIRCLTTDDTGADVITNEPEQDAGNAVEDAGTLPAGVRGGGASSSTRCAKPCPAPARQPAGSGCWRRGGQDRAGLRLRLGGQPGLSLSEFLRPGFSWGRVDRGKAA